MQEELTTLEFWEMLSYIVTVAAFLAIPAGIVTYVWDNKRERLAKQWEIDDKLKAEYNDILDYFIEHPELDRHDRPFEDETMAKQQRRIYEKVISLFESSFMRLYGQKEPELIRMWNSWEDYMGEWLDHANFRASLPRLLDGEDKDFAAYLQEKAVQVRMDDKVTHSSP